jgi:putative SOS response-associated peptidase YedK
MPETERQASSNALLGSIHERMLAILLPDDEALWVDADRGGSAYPHPAVPAPLPRRHVRCWRLWRRRSPRRSEWHTTFVALPTFSGIDVVKEPTLSRT